MKQVVGKQETRQGQWGQQHAKGQSSKGAEYTQGRKETRQSWDWKPPLLLPPGSNAVPGLSKIQPKKRALLKGTSLLT